MPSYRSDSRMKKNVMIVVTMFLVILFSLQVDLTTAQENKRVEENAAELRVIGPETAERLEVLIGGLDKDDPTTARLASLLADVEGRIAIAGLLNTLLEQAQKVASSQAIPSFIDSHFDHDLGGKLVPRPEIAGKFLRWKRQSERLVTNLANVTSVTADIASKMDASSEVGGLFKRLLEDPQVAITLLMTEMDGGDVIARYVSEGFGRILVDRGDGQFVIVESRRADAEAQVNQFERAEEIRQRLQRILPLLASEYTDADKKHQQLKSYLNDPVTAAVVAVEMSSEARSAGQACDRLYEQFEQASEDKPDGLHIASQAAWDQIEQIFSRVNRSKGVFPLVQDRLAEISDNLSTKDELTARLAAAMKRDSVATWLAAELPYAVVDPGKELRSRLSALLTERDGKLLIDETREEEIKAKTVELLRGCRRIRRYTSEIEYFLQQMEDQEFIQSMGEAGPYVMLREVRRFAASRRQDPVALMERQLLEQHEGAYSRVREDQRDVIRKLVEQADRLRAEAGNDDF